MLMTVLLLHSVRVRERESLPAVFAGGKRRRDIRVRCPPEALRDLERVFAIEHQWTIFDDPVCHLAEVAASVCPPVPENEPFLQALATLVACLVARVS